MRSIAVVLVATALAAGCAAPPRATSRATTAPALPAVATKPLAITPLVGREAMAWEVFWEGFTIGRVELSVGPTSRATFSTNDFASMLASIRYELVADPARAHERVSVRGTISEHAIDMATAAPGATQLHTLTSVLAAMRAWAMPGAPRTYAWVSVDGGLYRVDLAPPVRDRLDRTRALRVDGVIRPLRPGRQAQISVWLAEASDRSPLRFVVETGGERVVAQLRETSLTAR